jgi:hypothetical protein
VRREGAHGSSTARAHEQQSTTAADHGRTGAGRGSSLADRWVSREEGQGLRGK